MQICANKRSFRRVSAVLVAFTAAVGSLRADSIIFTKPAVPLAAPAKVEHDVLPRFKLDEEVNFVPVDPQPVMIPPRAIQVQPQPSRDKEDEDDKEHWLLRDPFKVRDRLGKDPFKAEVKKDPIRAPWQVQAMAKREKDKEKGIEKDNLRSLSPVNRFDWDGRDAKEPRKDSLAAWRRDEQEREKEDRERERPDPLKPPKNKNEERRDPFQSSIFYQRFGARSYEEPTVAELERRAAFEELLNPTPVANVKQPGSLEPVTGMDAPKPAPPVTLPAPVQSNARVDRGPLDPTAQFRETQNRLYGSGVLQDPSEKYAAQQPKSDAPKAGESVYQTPLLRQPLRRDIPTRAF
jgi:hypothetical protein